MQNWSSKFFVFFIFCFTINEIFSNFFPVCCLGGQKRGLGRTPWTSCSTSSPIPSDSAARIKTSGKCSNPTSARFQRLRRVQVSASSSSVRTWNWIIYQFFRLVLRIIIHNRNYKIKQETFKTNSDLNCLGGKITSQNKCLQLRRNNHITNIQKKANIHVLVVKR